MNPSCGPWTHLQPFPVSWSAAAAPSVPCKGQVGSQLKRQRIKNSGCRVLLTAVLRSLSDDTCEHSALPAALCEGPRWSEGTCHVRDVLIRRECQVKPRSFLPFFQVISWLLCQQIGKAAQICSSESEVACFRFSDEEPAFLGGCFLCVLRQKLLCWSFTGNLKMQRDVWLPLTHTHFFSCAFWFAFQNVSMKLLVKGLLIILDRAACVWVSRYDYTVTFARTGGLSRHHTGGSFAKGWPV